MRLLCGTISVPLCSLVEIYLYYTYRLLKVASAKLESVNRLLRDVHNQFEVAL